MNAAMSALIPDLFALAMIASFALSLSGNRKRPWRPPALWPKVKPLEFPATAEEHPQTVHLGELHRLNSALLPHHDAPAVQKSAPELDRSQEDRATISR
jgi:hypothetical protein